MNPLASVIFPCSFLTVSVKHYLLRRMVMVDLGVNHGPFHRNVAHLLATKNYNQGTQFCNDGDIVGGRIRNKCSS